MRAMVALLSLAGGCTAAVPRQVHLPSEPPAIVLPLAPPVVFSVSEPAHRYGGPTEPTASPLADAFADAARGVAGTRGEIARDGRLDQLCAELAPVIAAGVTPSDALIQLALHTHGVPESTGRVLTVRNAASQEAALEALRSALGDELAGRFRIGLASERPGLTVAILVRSSGVILEVPRAVAAGASFVIEGRLIPQLRNARVKILHGDGSVAFPAAVSGPGGRFTAPFSCGDHQGRQWIEIAAEALQGVISLVGVPVECGAPAVATFRAEPAGNVSGLATQDDLEQRLTAIVNRERAAVRLAPLRTDPLLAAQARRHAERAHAGTPDRRDARERLRAAGVEPPRLFELTFEAEDAVHAAEALSNERVYRALLDRPDITHTGVGVALGASASGRPRLTITVSFVEFLPFIDPERIRGDVLAAIREDPQRSIDWELVRIAQRFANYLAGGRRRDEVWPEIKQDIDRHANEPKRYEKVFHRVFKRPDVLRVSAAELLQDGPTRAGFGVGVAQSARYGRLSGLSWIVVLAGRRLFTSLRGAYTTPG